MILKLLYIWLVFYSILSLLMHATMDLKRNPWPVFIPYGEIKVHTPTKQRKLQYHIPVVQKYQLTANRCMKNLMFIIKYALIVILEFSYELYCQGLNMNTTFHSCTVHLDII
jgi:hypothetical protein